MTLRKAFLAALLAVCCAPASAAWLWGGAPTGYSTSAIDYDGSTNYAARGAALTGSADGKTGTLSIWFRIDGAPASAAIIGQYINATRGLHVGFTSGSALSITGYSAIGTARLDWTGTATYSSGSTWYHVLASWDLTDSAKRFVYINDSADAGTYASYVNNTIAYSGTGDFGLGAYYNGNNKFSGCISEVWFTTAYLDISQASNRRLFISAAGKPVSLGSDGSIPTGTAPLLYAKGGDPSSNTGSGGNFTFNGSKTACSSTP